MITETVRPATLHRVREVRTLSPGAFVLRMDRRDLVFRPGQWINVGIPGTRQWREYSVYSSPADDFLEILVKEVPEGAVSPRLRRLSPGDRVEVEGPHGAFLIEDGDRPAGRFIFVATGTGISPFHCFARSYPGLDYLLLHGVRRLPELYEHHVFEPSRVVSCVSREAGPYSGRVTQWLLDNPPDTGSRFYACGNSDMVYDAFAVLRPRGVPRSRLFAEVYF
jgi:ferredoxin/flavodoxin---NADP+ reductase